MPAPPDPPRRPVRIEQHGDVRVDEWAWLRDRDDPAVPAHLEAENRYTDAVLGHLGGLREALYEEISARVEHSDVSAPVLDGRYEYYVRTDEGRQYARQCRRPLGGGTEEVLLDEDAEAAEHPFFAVGDFVVSPDHAFAAYTIDVEGHERMTLRIRDLGSGADLADRVPDVYYGLAWSADATTLFYVRPDHANRPFQVWRHRRGTPADDDVLVFEEPDERFFVYVRRTRTGRLVLVESASKSSAETWYVPADAPTSALAVIEPRAEGLEYAVEHHTSPTGTDRVYVVTNDGGADDFKLVEAPLECPGRESWIDVVAHRPGIRLRSAHAFARHVVLAERSEARQHLRVLHLDDGTLHDVDAPDPVYAMSFGDNREFDTACMRFQYSSLVLPASDYDHDLDARRNVLVKRQDVRGYDPDAYVSDRAWAKAADGVPVPISIVHRRDVTLDGEAPLLLTGYGAYEASYDPTFRTSRVSLLDRGVVVAIAHVRGGGEMGRAWYEQGRLAEKAHTFTDFLACAAHLVDAGYTRRGRIVARGRSAGGLLMGAVANLDPEMFAAVVAEVPFVDVLSTMSDDSLPLTVTEWEEWGDPRDAEAYGWMRAYSPFDNVRRAPYPRILATAGFHDSRVQYWEPAKWVARIRERTTARHPALLRVELGAGHRGPSGRYDAWRDEAFVLAFVLDALGIGT